MKAALEKVPSGIAGLDELTRGGLPKGRSVLVCGGAGCGKTMLGLQFLVNGARDHDEPGALLAFEESAPDLAENVASLGWDLEGLQSDGKLVIDHVRVEPVEIHETGAYSLDGLLLRLEGAIAEVGAKRVVLDTLEVLFSALEDSNVLRAELRRLFRWLKDRGVTSIITSERGTNTMTRHGIEEYVSDCVLLLDHRVNDQVSTRRVRVVKYRGSEHDTDETPFLIDGDGLRVMPVSSMRLEHPAPDERVSTGIERLDVMLGREGYHRGSSILITGTPGAGKTTLASAFAAAGCARGERVLVTALEESPAQIVRNMGGVGIDLATPLEAGLLRMSSVRPTARGFEEHLAAIFHDVVEFEPQLVVIDPMSAFAALDQRQAMLARLVDLLKVRGITALFTSLQSVPLDDSGLGISSIIDTWIGLGTVEYAGERNRSLTIIKARGTAHSNQVREFVISSSGIELLDVYTGSGKVYMGTARAVLEAEDRAAEAARHEESQARQRSAERRRVELEAQINVLKAQLATEVEKLQAAEAAELQAEERRSDERVARAQARGADEQ